MIPLPITIVASTEEMIPCIQCGVHMISAMYFGRAGPYCPSCFRTLHPPRNCPHCGMEIVNSPAITQGVKT